MFEVKFKDFVIKNNLLNNFKKLLLAVSGGPDSLAMLNLFYKFSEEFNLKIAAAHLDHMFREESKAEADFVEAFAENKNIKFFRKKVNLPQLIKENNLSAEAAARKERFDFFKEIIKKDDFDLLALAHHRDDQAETLLLNLFRGSGLQGLSSIRPKAEVQKIKVIHPMLCFSKEEILDYCYNNNLQPRFDSSNDENIYSRNVIRNKIIPAVELEINENVREVIARSSNLIAAENKFMQQLTLEKYQEIVEEENSDQIIIDFSQFKGIDRVLQRRIYRYIYQQLNDSLDDLYLDHILEIEKLLNDKQSGRGVDIASGIRVEISYSSLAFLKKKNLNNTFRKRINFKKNETVKINQKWSLELKIDVPKNYNFNNYSKQAAFDYDKLNLPLFIRNRKSGDQMRPLGMKGHKKVKDILIDEKVPKYERNQLPLVIDADNNIIWLAPYKISDDYKITEETEKILIFELKYN